MFLQNLASFAVAMSVAVDERKFELKMKLKLNIFVPRKTETVPISISSNVGLR